MMINFIFLTFSVIFVALSSYLFVSCFSRKITKNALLFWILLVISQVIISFEILSVFKLISMPAFMVSNIIFFAGSIIFRNFYTPPPNPLCENEFALLTPASQPREGEERLGKGFALTPNPNKFFKFL